MEKTTGNVALTFPFGSTNCIRFKGYISAQGTPKVFVNLKTFILKKKFIFLLLNQTMSYFCHNNH